MPLCLWGTISLFPACSTTQSSNHSTTLPIPELDKESVWQLVEMAGRSVPSDAGPITLQFNPEAGTLRGQSSCNTYSADYTLSPTTYSYTGSLNSSATLKLSNHSHTDIQCAEAQMNTEQRYLALLAKCNHLSINDTKWTLTLSNKGRTPLVFSLQ